MRKIRCYILKHNGEPTPYRKIVSESGNIIAIAVYRSVQDYIDECLHGDNECAYLIEKFHRIKNGKDAILWQDSETGELFISY